MARGKSRRRKRTRRTDKIPQLQEVPPAPTAPPPQIPASQASRVFSYVRKGGARTWTVFLAIAAVIGFVAALYPRVSPQALEATDPTNVFTAPVMVTNSSFYTFYDARSACVQVKGSMTGGNAYWNRFSQNIGGDKIGDIGPGQPATILCDFVRAMATEAQATDFMIELSFRPAFIPSFVPFRLKRSFRLVVMTDQRDRARVVLQPSLPLPCIGHRCE